MTNKDISAIRKRFNLEKNNITVIRGCYVSSQGEIISTFSRSLRGMGQEEAEKYLAIFKKTLSGTQGQNLIDIDFDPEKMADSPEYQHLTHLKDSALKDDELVEDFYNQVIGNTGLEDPYLILLMHDGYDVPHHSKDGRVMDSDTVFHYILCAVCPVKMTKPTLSYNADRNLFTSKDADWVVSSPEIGFLFPAFEEKAANIYRAVFYTKDTSVPHDDFVAAVFMSQFPMPADEQKERFQTIMQESLGEECSYKVMQAVHESVMEKIEAQKETKSNEPIRLTKYDVLEAIEECGVSTEHMDAFKESFDREFGEQTRLNAVNVTNPKQFEVRTPNAVLRVDADRYDLVETREIDGHTYVMLRADEGIEVVGVSIASALPSQAE